MYFILIIVGVSMVLAAFFLVARKKSRLKSLEKNTQNAPSLSEIINQKREQERLKKALYDLQLAQAQLLQKEKLASLGQLAAGIAHEINNPIGFIKGNMEMMEETVGKYEKVFSSLNKLAWAIKRDDRKGVAACLEELEDVKKQTNLDFLREDTPKLIEESKRGIERIRKIVQNLQIFTARDTEQMVTLNVEEVIDNVLTLTKYHIRNNVMLKKEYGHVPAVKGFTQQLGQVFMNIITNAAQAIREDGAILIRTYQKDNHVFIEIQDTGAGISEDNLKHIFDPFFTTKPVGQGIGLGLSASLELIKKHQGDIIVESRLGLGSIFTVQLPTISGQVNAKAYAVSVC